MAASNSSGAPNVNPQILGAPPWWGNLTLNDKGMPRAVLINGDIALGQDPLFQDAFAFDKFRSETMLVKPVPWEPNLISPRVLTDADDYEGCVWLQQHFIYLIPKTVKEIINGLAMRNWFHPVIDYFNTLGGVSPATSIWDRTPRLDTWLSYYCGADDNEYTRAIGARWLISAIARIYQPGCKVDCVLVLEGKTGIGKSTVFKVLGHPWYTNAIAALSSENAKEQIIGVWIVELDELDAVNRASEFASVLSFVSTSADHFRLKYGRRSGNFPRQCIFGGTTERDSWVREFVGYRRWWPVKCGPSIDIDALANDRDQLFAEALVRYGMGEKWWIHEDHLIDQARDEQEARVERDIWEDAIVTYLRGKKTVTTPEILSAIGVELSRAGRNEQMRVANILKRHKWQRRQRTLWDNTLGKQMQKWCYISPDEAQREEDEGRGFGTE